MKIERIIIFEGGIETQDFFSAEIAKAFREWGYAVFPFDLRHEEKSMRALEEFFLPARTALVTFNFHGLSGEAVFLDGAGTLMWERLLVPIYNVVVDHPLYYHGFLENVPVKTGLYHQICIDRRHVKYMKEYFPQVEDVRFIPLAGTALPRDIPWENRRYDIIFTGNYTPPETFDRYITRIDEEYEAFYRGMISDLTTHPGKTLEETAEVHIKREIPEVTRDELKRTMPNLNFIDLYVRFQIRGRVIGALAESGLKVDVFGEGWDKLKTTAPENIIVHGSRDSMGCLRAISNSKISVNIMPWFKDGAHDRVFNSCLNGALCVTDDSIYLREVFKGNDVLFYSHDGLKEMTERVKYLLSAADEMKSYIEKAGEISRRGHTWRDFAEALRRLLGR